MFRRLLYFLGLNLVLLMTFSIILSFVPMPSGRYAPLLIMYALFGFGGALVSLFMSIRSAKWSMRVQSIDPQSPKNETEAWLLNTVHDYAKKAGLPKMPEVGIYPGQELNAFATGPSKSKSLVAVSEGLLRQMTKEEVEGVLGHEVAHIKNGDMVTMVLLQGVINTLVMFAARVLGDLVASMLSRDNENRGGSFFMSFLLYQVFAFLLGFLGMMVTGAFSRKREYRADAGGARLAGAQKMLKSLQKLQMVYESQHTANKSAQDRRNEPVAALKISGRFKRSWFAQLMSTHPPLEMRIRELKKRAL